jgi:hypothetical protein
MSRFSFVHVFSSPCITCLGLDFFVNKLENRVGYDINGDGYIGGEGPLNSDIIDFAHCFAFI